MGEFDPFSALDKGIAPPPLPFDPQKLIHPPPKHSKRLLVQLITRHGARTPITILGDSHTNRWQCPTIYETFSLHAMSLIQPTAGNNTFSYGFTPHMQSHPGNCSTGQLTIRGMIQMHALGASLRHHLVNVQHFLPPQFHQNLFYIRSTNVQRTIQSAQSVFSGFYPMHNLYHDQPHIHLTEEKLENMYPRYGCQYMKKMIRQMRNSKETVARIQSFNDLRPLVQNLQNLAFSCTVSHPYAHNTTSKHPSLNEWLHDFATCALQRKSKPSLAIADLFNTIECYNLEGLPLPFPISSKQWQRIQEFADAYMEAKVSTPSFVRLGIGRFVRDTMVPVAQVVHSHLEGSDTPSIPKFFMYSGHDNTVAPYLAAFGVFDGKHPPMASALIMELFYLQDVDDPLDRYVVRWTYNGKILKLPCSRTSLLGESYCYVKDLLEIAQHVVPRDYEEECASET